MATNCVKQILLLACLWYRWQSICMSKAERLESQQTVVHGSTNSVQVDNAAQQARELRTKNLSEINLVSEWMGVFRQNNLDEVVVLCNRTSRRSIESCKNWRLFKTIKAKLLKQLEKAYFVTSVGYKQTAQWRKVVVATISRYCTKPFRSVYDRTQSQGLNHLLKKNTVKMQDHKGLDIKLYYFKTRISSMDSRLIAVRQDDLQLLCALLYETSRQDAADKRLKKRWIAIVQDASKNQPGIMSENAFECQWDTMDLVKLKTRNRSRIQLF